LKKYFVPLRAFSLLVVKTLIFISLILSLFNPILPQKQPIRIINLKIAADEELRMKLTWQLDVKKLIKTISKDFESHFGIQFNIKRFENWTSDNSIHTTFNLLNDLRKKVLHEDCDIVIGVTAQENIKNDIFGIAAYLQGFIVLREFKDISRMDTLLKHEICHVFGVADLYEKNSIMSIKARGYEFDEFTSRIIFLNKYRNFNLNTFPLSDEILKEIISVYEQRKISNSNETDIRFSLAMFYFQLQDYQSTLKECNHLIQMNPDSPEALHFMGMAYRRMGKIDQAINEYRKVLQSQPALPEIYTKALELNPNYAEAYSNLGNLYVEKRMADEAIESCQKALEFNPQSAKALSHLGAAYILKNMFREAEAASKKALGIDPGLEEPHNNLGIIFINRDMFDQGINEYIRAIEINPDYAEAHHNLGRAYYLRRQIDRAIGEYKEAIRIKPDYYKAYSNLASAYMKKGMVEEAIKELKNAIKIKPDYGIAYYNLGFVYLGKKMLEEAEIASRKAITLNPELPEPHILLGAILEIRNRDDEAEIEFKKAIKLKPNYLEAHLNLGNLYLTKNLLSDSAFHYNKVIEINPHFGQAYNNLALIFFYQEKYTLALEYTKMAEQRGFKVPQEFKRKILDLVKK
jgi:tetratricopeptide (TPR) repeat protein